MDYPSGQTTSEKCPVNDQPNECMANVGVGFSQDLVASSQGMGPAFHGYPKVGKSQVLAVGGPWRRPWGPPAFHGYPRVPMKKPDGPELACHRADLIPSSNVGKWEPQKGGGARSAPPPHFPISLLDGISSALWHASSGQSNFLMGTLGYP